MSAEADVADLDIAAEAGKAVFDADPGTNELCLRLHVARIHRITSVHLHAGHPESAANVAKFTVPSRGPSAGCVTVTQD